MNKAYLHPDFQLSFDGKSYSAQAFLAIEESLQWIVDIQDTVRFWMSKAGVLEVQTSGSTGSPKIISLSKGMLVASAKNTISFFGLNQNSRVLLAIPAKYIGGKMVVFRAMLAGMKLDMVEPKAGIPKLNEGFDFVSLTPMQAEKSFRELTQFKSILLGGGPVQPALERRLQTISAQVYLGYGMTETASHVALRALNGPDKSEVFEAVGSTTFQTDSRGCLTILAPDLLPETLQTNDIVKTIDNRHFKWLGRVDHVINSGGIKIHPEMLEKKMATLINKPFFIAGLPDDLLGERVVLVVESNIEPDIDWSRLPKLERPKTIYMVPGFVYTSTQKINREATLRLVQNIQ